MNVRRILKSLLGLIVGFGFNYQASATHTMAADIEYECLGGNDYLVTLNYYNDCAGIGAPTSVSVNFTSAFCGTSFSATLSQTSLSGQEVSQVCPGDLVNTTCNGGTLPGVEFYQYQAVVSFPANCPDWRVWWRLCCRNNMITNLQTPGSYSIYIDATLDNMPGNCNSSPVHSSMPILYACVGESVCYSHGTTDPDGHDLVYSLINPLDNVNNPIPHTAGFSATYPISTASGTFSINPLTGEMCFTPDIQQVGVISVKIEKYHKNTGQLLDVFMREMQVIVYNCSSGNQTPYLSSTNTFGNGMINVSGGTLTGAVSVEVCQGGTVSWQAEFTDPDAGDNLTITTNGGTSTPGATIGQSGSNPATLNFSWTPAASDTGLNVLTATISDDACPMTATTTQSFEILVLPDEPNQPGSISGSTIVCENTSESYSVTLDPIADFYTWTVPSGWSISSGQGTNAVTVFTGTTGGNICVTASNSCGTSPASCLSVSVEAVPPAPSSVVGNNDVCENLTYTYSTQSVSGADTYNWTVPSGASIITGQGTTSIDVMFGANSGNVCVEAINNNCGSNGPVCLFVNASPTSVGGIVLEDDTICEGSNNGTLTLSGYTGSILKWRSTTDGTNWTDIANTSSTQGYSNLTDTTTYQAIVQSGTCVSDTSATATLVVLPSTTGGTLLKDTAVCALGISDTLELIGASGTISHWESSIDGGNTWDSIPNTDDTLIYNLTLNSGISETTLYRVVISGAGGGTCPGNVSSIAAITINAPTQGGIVLSDTTVCKGSNNGVLVLSGDTGSVINWEASLDSTAWFVLSNSSSSLTFNNLAQTTWYRVRVQNADCNVEYSIPAKVTVDEKSAGGSVIEDATVCSGNNGDVLDLVNINGSILDWIYTEDSGVSWNNLGNSSNTYAYSNLTTTTGFAAIVQNGVCPADTSDEAVITIDPPVIDGMVTPDDTVCASGNSGTLTLSGHQGNIVRWELSTDSATWMAISNTTTTQNYSNLIQTTWYRVALESGVCGTGVSLPAKISVIPESYAGFIIGGNTSVCEDTSYGQLVLIGYTGSIIDWESSIDGGVSWSSVGSTSDTISFTNLTTTTVYQAIVQNGICDPDTSSKSTITVNPQTVGGTVLDDDTVCAGMNTGTLYLTGHTGTVLNWERSTDGGSTWNVLSNSADSLTYVNITQTSMYRVLIQSGSGCDPAYSSIATIVVITPSDGGNIEFGNTVCNGDNGDTLTLNAYNGAILYWKASTDGGNSWNTISNTSDTLSYNNLNSTTWYQAFVQNGICPVDSSTIAAITVDDSTQAGILTGNDTVCAGMNSGTITLSGYVGAIQGWEASTDGGITWNALINFTDVQNYNNLTTTTQYRVRVKSGVCDQKISNVVTIVVHANSNAGVLEFSDSVCELSNGDTIELSGYTGDITEWLYSGDEGSTWNDAYPAIPGGPYPDTVVYNNLDSTVSYIAIVKNGVCPPDTSEPVIISVSEESIGGFILSDDTVCSGQNSGMVFLNGETGTIERWEVSTDGQVNWTPLSNVTDSLTFNNITQTTSYRVRVKSGACPFALSEDVTITIQQPTVAGVLAGDTVICGESQLDILKLQSYSGDIVKWQFTEDEGDSWNDIIHGYDTLEVTGIGMETWYRVILKAGVCPADTTEFAKFILPPGDGIIAVDDEIWLKGGQNATVKATQNDTGYWDVLTLLSTGHNGLATNNNNGNISYIPNPDYLGVDSLNYQLCEAVCGMCDTATVRIEVGLFIPTGFSPDGDGYNDQFVITGMDNYPENNITIFNRWGDVVFSAEPYQNDWDGRSENARMVISGDNVIEGTYFYIIHLGQGEKPVNGYVELRRGN